MLCGLGVLCPKQLEGTLGAMWHGCGMGQLGSHIFVGTLGAMWHDKPHST